MTPTEINVKPGCYCLVNVMGALMKTTNYKQVCSYSTYIKLMKMMTKIMTSLKLLDKHATTFYLDEKDEFVVSKSQIISVAGAEAN